MKPKDHILQELEELGSPLAGHSRAMPYAVPDGYFEGLAAGVLRAAKDTDVPPGYFQHLPQAMLAAAKDAAGVSSAAKQKTRVFALPRARQWAAAAVLLVSFGIGAVLLFNDRRGTTKDLVATLPAEEVQEYVATDLYDSDLVTLDAFPGIIADANAPTLSGLSNTELEAYLAEEGLLF